MPADKGFEFQSVNVTAPRGYLDIHEKYKEFTMIPPNRYLENLMLVDHVGQRVPGDFVECGTWRGGMSCGMMAVSKGERHFHFFDSFEGLPPPRADRDGEDAMAYHAAPNEPGRHDNCRAEYEGFVALVHAQGVPADRIHVHRGWFQDTLPHYGGGPVSVLRLDGDWYESTMTCLEALYDRVSPGGAVILDDYDDWDGCALALHDFLSRRRLPTRIHRTAYSRVAFLIKGV